MEKRIIMQEIFWKVKKNGFIIHWRSDLLGTEYGDAFWTLAGELSNLNERLYSYHPVYTPWKQPRCGSGVETLSFLVKKDLQIEQQEKLFDEICAMLENNALEISLVIEDLYRSRIIQEYVENALPKNENL